MNVIHLITVNCIFNFKVYYLTINLYHFVAIVEVTILQFIPPAKLKLADLNDDVTDNNR